MQRRRLNSANRQRPYSTGNAYITLYQSQNSEGVPPPPLRWDSHQVAVDLSQGNQPPTTNTVIIQSGRRNKNKRPSSSGSPRQIRDPREILRYITSNGIIGGQTCLTSGGNQEPTTTQVQIEAQTQCNGTIGMRERSASAESGYAHLSRVSTASQTSLEGNSEILPPCVNMATNTDNNRGRPCMMEDITNANIRGATPRDNEPLSPMTLSRLQIGNIPCAIGSQLHTPDNDNVFCSNDNHHHIRMALGRSPLTEHRRCIRTPNGTILSPTFATPSDKSHSGSSERLTGTSTTTSRSSRGSTSSSGRHHRRRRSNGRSRTSTTSTCSTSPTDQSSQSSSNGSFGRQRRQARPAPPSSSSSDSETEFQLPPSRRMVAKMINGVVQNVMQDDFSVNSALYRQRPQRNRRSSGSSTNTPPRGRTRNRRPVSDRNKSPGTRNGQNSASKDTKTSDNTISGSVPPPLIPSQNNEGDVVRRHKRPDSLDLNLNKSWMPRQRRSLVLVPCPIDLEDPWVRRDSWPRGVAMPQSKSQEAKISQVSTSKNPHGGNSNSQHNAIDNRMAECTITAATQSHQDNKNQVHYGNSNGPMHLGTTEMYARTHSVLPSDKKSVSAPIPRAAKPKLKQRPKSMVELTKNTQYLVTKYLDQTHGVTLSPAIKTVLEDIQSVINSDESHLAEILQSTDALDQYVVEKTGKLSLVENCNTNEVIKPVVTVSGADLDAWTGRNKLCSLINDNNHVIRSPQADPNVSGARPKGTNTLRREMVRNLQDAKETIL